MNAVGAEKVSSCDQYEVERLHTWHRTQMIVANAVVMPTTTVIVSFYSALLDMKYTYLHWSEYAFKIIPGIQL